VSAPAQLFTLPKRAATDPDIAPRVSVAYIGDAGQGKTHCACSWPNPVLIAWDTNRATAEKLIGPERIIVPQSYSHYQREILPVLTNRQLTLETLGFPVDTIIEDTLSFKIQQLVDETPVNPKNTYERWEKVKTACRLDTRKLLSITKPYPGDPTRPTYNLVVTWHLAYGTDENGKQIAAKPAFEGAFSNDVARYFDCVFYCEQVTKTKMTNGQVVTLADGRPDREAVHMIHTVNPDMLIRCKEGIGGGRWKKLPSRMGGTYAELAAAWGFPTAAQSNTK
jgi:hypothetical protein